MRMQIARVMSLFLVLILAFVAAGCPGPDEIASTPEELVERMAEAIRDVGSYQIEMEMAMALKTVIHGETIEMTGLVHSAGQFDLINQRARTTMIIEMATSPKPGVPVEVTRWDMYWLDGMMYLKLPMMPGMPLMWIKGEMPWVCSLEQTVDLLKVSQIEILRMEEMNGVESYLIKVAPDLAKLWEILNEGMMLGPPGMLLNPEAIDFELEEMFKDVSLKKWIARDTFLPVKDQLQMTMVFEGIAMEQKMKMRTISRSHSFNEPLNIDLPAEAAEAKEVPGW